MRPPVWVALLGLGCAGEPVPTPWGEHPDDGALSLAHAQVVGTHNSYHVQTTDGPFWAYTHLPLDQQLVTQGVRQFELDLAWGDAGWEVLHIPVLDAGTTCLAFEDCLRALRAGSERLGPHLPALVLLEIKQPWTEAEGPERLALLHDQVEAILGEEHLLRPAAVQGSAPTLRDGMVDGWPVLRGQRGRFIVTVHDRGAWADTTRALELPALFTDAYGDLDAPWAAVHSLNDPTDPRIPEVVAAGHLVRTRADVDVVQPAANDPSMREAAWASGATFVSTDFPAPHPDTGYVVQAPGGTPARCNPVWADAACTSQALEDPDIVGPRDR